MKANMRHNGNVAARQQLGRDEVHHGRRVEATQLPGYAHAMQAQLRDVVANALQFGWERDFAVLEFQTLAVDFGDVRRDLFGDELPHEVNHVDVALFGFIDALRSVGRGHHRLHEFDEVVPG